ncbi:1-aminocyclopropane-1-carboxylate oxidase homolog 1-like [Humulus lupulus]|uniref:1-aminocyclopropane-1-carboxylate oxidase homolog 1-like n=1 Tax=Humulus lupulus TaxID=3486 RepID=UPI002B412175|nr:1-aminocyclopropane-1-carboxylate oxidase homolog 1-like [Humulus lupulus]
MIEGVRKFNEQQQKLKMEFYSCDKMKKVQFLSNFDLYVSKSASWRDTLMCLMAPNPPKPEEYPAACSRGQSHINKEMREVGNPSSDNISNLWHLRIERLRKEVSCLSPFLFRPLS